MRNNRERYLLVNRAIGLLSRRDFLSVKRMAPNFSHYDDYDDWYAEREGLQIGLSTAGVETSLVVIEVGALRDWSRTHALPMTEDALDQLAAHAVHDRSSDARWLSMVADSAHDLLHARLN